jgi:hypothetical protein
MSDAQPIDFSSEAEKLLESVANEYARQAQAVGFSEDDKFLTISEALKALTQLHIAAVQAELEKLLAGLPKNSNNEYTIVILDRIAELQATSSGEL